MVRGIELSLRRLGTVLAWLMIGLAVLATSVLVLRYGFGVGSIALQDAVLYLNALLVLLGISVTLTANAHVRVDVWSSRWQDKTRALVDLMGVLLLLLPMIVAIAWFSWDYVLRAWSMHEGSGDAGGMAGVYWVKSLVLLGDALLLLAAVAFGYRAFLAWRGQDAELPVEHQHEL
jgi:TRAP-type mannitol/chloroaromatic compound transport system permease small subunit